MSSTAALHDRDSGFEKQRASMLTNHLESRGISDPRVLAAMGRVPREEFVPADERDEAYRDGPLPIGHGQTISQPYTVAMMCEALQLTGNENVLEVGTGSGYAACVLSHLARQVHTIERIPELARLAEACLQKLGIRNVRVHVGDGSLGLPEAAPFHAIVVTAGGPSVPVDFVNQLVEGGRIVMPVGPMHDQTMCRYTRRDGTLVLEELGAFRFVPLIGAEAWPDDSVA
ncbi:MAG: protein-L-isoaspartate(D-aspartate) O-methyltransferase [Fuerstia sp.]|nr:protein-L-isoaspartate(D-aspartate) O-methyltransferase [Fuerstiella sp.]